MNRMNLKMSLLASVSVPLILAGPASGAFTGLKAEKKFVDPAHIIADAANIPGVTSLLVVNVYANFTPGAAAAAVIGVGGSAALGIPLQINTRDGTFFQHIFQNASGTAPGAAFFPLAPSLRYDSFVTVGAKTGSDPVFGANQTQVIGLDTWTDTRLTGSPEVSWFLAGFPPQGNPGQGPVNPPDKVLIGQYSVVNPGPTGGVFGSMFVNFRHTNAAGVVEVITLPAAFDNQVPAPGTLALLGVVGLMSGRRRRR